MRLDQCSPLLNTAGSTKASEATMVPNIAAIDAFISRPKSRDTARQIRIAPPPSRTAPVQRGMTSTSYRNTTFPLEGFVVSFGNLAASSPLRTANLASVLEYSSRGATTQQHSTANDRLVKCGTARTTSTALTSFKQDQKDELWSRCR